MSSIVSLPRRMSNSIVNNCPTSSTLGSTVPLSTMSSNVPHDYNTSFDATNMQQMLQTQRIWKSSRDEIDPLRPIPARSVSLPQLSPILTSQPLLFQQFIPSGQPVLLPQNYTPIGLNPPAYPPPPHGNTYYTTPQMYPVPYDVPYDCPQQLPTVHNHISTVVPSRRKPKQSITWSPKEDKLLRRLKEVEKLGWREISTFFHGRTPNACQFRWRRLVCFENSISNKSKTYHSIDFLLNK